MKNFFALFVFLYLALLCLMSACTIYLEDVVWAAEAVNMAALPEDVVTVVEPTLEFINVAPFRDGLANVLLKNGKRNFLNTDGNIVFPMDYDFAGWFGEGMVYINKDGNQAIINKNGDFVASVDYDTIFSADDFQNGLAVVIKLNEKTGYSDSYGFLDINGNIAVPMIYDRLFKYSEGFAAVLRDSKWGFIDNKGNTVIPLVYDSAQPFSEGLAAVKKDEKWGFIDSNGQTVIPFEYEGAGEFMDGLAPVRKGNWDNRKWGYIDIAGNIVVPLEYKFAYSFSEGLAVVEKDEKYGFIDITGNIVVPLQYDDVYSSYSSETIGFNEGLAGVKHDNKYGFINTKGKVVVPIIYEVIHNFNNGYTPVRIDGKWGVLHNTVFDKQTEDPQYPFNDIRKDAWYFNGVIYTFEHGLMNGTAVDRFSPGSSLTRGMLVTILYRYLSEPDNATLEMPFTDVPSNTWYTAAVIWAAYNGIVEGYGNGLFGPFDALNREQLATILYRFQTCSGKIPQDTLMGKEYPDWNDISSYAKNPVNVLTMQGILRDIPGTDFLPKKYAVRAEVAAMLHRYFEAVE